ncbi:splicing factor 3a [Salpingoeca rosetta]|uniref:Splicing factor 3a n=1 Tax=Salpingoeca rosetta (strain ATCC 50818 / BSB-021) TaxID=946362 RepID=F2TVS8_SALR5|nr:splicing factor 3a [Salpingoeca rosetta]EGD72174.1 splicing factor 3a [Salpingoeca rosetta]|eukprot:XP_004998746.1 splicing factor 3a [Salpingoeca rosetta]
MDFLVEKQRQLHEEVDRLVKDGATVMQHKFDTQKSKVNALHLQRLLVDRMSNNARELVELYNDADGERKKEIDALSVNPFESFYEKLGEIKEYHKEAPNAIARPVRTDILPDFLQPEALLEAQQQKNASRKRKTGNDKPAETKTPGLAGFVEFSGEESHGRFLDLHEHFVAYNNLKGVPHMEYLEYVQTFDLLSELPRQIKKTAAYKSYINNLAAYLVEFYRRTNPLADIDAELAQAQKDFEALWASGKFRGWQDVKPITNVERLDLSAFSSASELEALGMDRLKSALMAEGLKCGGTLQQRAQRLFSTKGVPREKWSKAILAKGAKRNANGASANANGSTGNNAGGVVSVVDEKKEVASVEARILVMAKLLSQVRRATKENVERKMARSAGEVGDEEDLPEIDDEFESDEEEDEDMKVGKRNALVLGPDGKPIPYWLYRLHGLNIIYTCEICGNYPYRGPKNFQQHFTEWRHAQGMRALGIPNTKHFANVTNINDAKALWARLQDQKAQERFEPDQEEEYEDSMGNVVNKKTYNDLLKQGLL